MSIQQDDKEQPTTEMVELATHVVSAYVSNNTVPAAELPDLIISVQRALSEAQAAGMEAPKEELEPAVPIRRSVTPDAIICLEDGKRFKSLKRHLQTHHGMTPDEYRQRWNLPFDYPIVAPNYAAARSEMAKSFGFGQKRKGAATNAAKPTAKASPKANSKKGGRSRKKAV